MDLLRCARNAQAYKPRPNTRKTRKRCVGIKCFYCKHFVLCQRCHPFYAACFRFTVSDLAPWCCSMEWALQACLPSHNGAATASSINQWVISGNAEKELMASHTIASASRRHLTHLQMLRNAFSCDTDLIERHSLSRKAVNVHYCLSLLRLSNVSVHQKTQVHMTNALTTPDTCKC